MRRTPSPLGRWSLLLACLLAGCALRRLPALTPMPLGATPTPPRTAAAGSKPAAAAVAETTPAIAPSGVPTVSPVPTRTMPASLSPSPSTTASEVSPVHVSLMAPGELPTPPTLVKGDGPEVYILLEGKKRHVIDWETFLSLGYHEEEILVSPMLLQVYEEGSPLGRLLQGSGDAVYWLEGGLRRHVPDRETLNHLGYGEEDISPVPDTFLISFPLGQPLESVRGPVPRVALPVATERVASTYHPLGGGPRLVELYTVYADGSRPARLTFSGAGNAENMDPAWSPDGQLLAYTACSDGSSGSCAVHVVGSNGGSPRQLAEPLTHFPAWSADGTRIVFWSSRYERIYIMDTDGRNLRALAQGRNPAWTPEGRIAFWAGASDPRVLSVMETDGRRVPLDGGRVRVYDQRYHPWRQVEWVSAGNPFDPTGP